MENIFELKSDELKNIANCLQERIEEGLTKDGMEILAIPTYITPKQDITNGKVLALDWGGVNFRAAIVEFKNGKPLILEIKTSHLSQKETTNFKQNDLYAAMANVIKQLETLDETVKNIGYCFSYPARCEKNGDATLLHWAKGISISDMQGEYKEPTQNNVVGGTLLEYLNKNINTKFENIKVINDTVACLFGGLSEAGYDNYIGLIVGTGTNMAALMHSDKIEKLDNDDKNGNLIPVNLESGGFFPPYLTIIDGLVDAMTNNRGEHRFEKAISGGYLGEMFKTVFMHEKIKYDFDGEDLSKTITDNPYNYSKEKVDVARCIAERSAKLVAASIAGLAQTLVNQDHTTKKIALAADGSVFWKTPSYKKMVETELKSLLPAGVIIEIIDEMESPNLIGSAIAALS